MNHLNKIYAVDFDDTLAITNFPLIVEPKMNMINVCKRLRQRGNIVILWTCRCGADLAAAVDYCKQFGLEFDYINEGTPENVEKFGNDSRKIFADVYIDDKSYNPEEKLSDDALYIRMWQNYENSVLDMGKEIARIMRPVLEMMVDCTNKLKNIEAVKERKKGKEDGE